MPPRVIVGLYTIELPCSPSLQKNVVSHSMPPFRVTAHLIVAAALSHFPVTKNKAFAWSCVVTMAFCVITKAIRFKVHKGVCWQALFISRLGSCYGILLCCLSKPLMAQAGHVIDLELCSGLGLSIDLMWQQGPLGQTVQVCFCSH